MQNRERNNYENIIKKKYRRRLQMRVKLCTDSVGNKDLYHLSRYHSHSCCAEDMRKRGRRRKVDFIVTFHVWGSQLR